MPSEKAVRLIRAGIAAMSFHTRYDAVDGGVSDILCETLGLSPDGNLVETVEYASHPFFIGVQYHPEFKSRPNKPHPLFMGLVKASLKK